LRPDLPILGRHSLLKPSWTEAVTEARPASTTSW
jgi:hypothetical protein